MKSEHISIFVNGSTMNTRIVIAFAAVLMASGVLCAAPVTVTVAGTFQDGGTFSGQITFDNATNVVLSFNVTTSPSGVFGSTYALPGPDTGSISLGPYTPAAFVIVLQHPPGGSALTLILPGTPSTFAGASLLPTVAGSGGATSWESAPFPPFPTRLLSNGIAAIASPQNIPAVSLNGLLAIAVLLGVAGAFLLRC